ncbi:MAG: glutathionylspermidine synthase family protein [Marinilabiliales bacterium]|nr:glutathionylspermidine synthase family protein [Marinilabiliales bacterium]
MKRHRITPRTDWQNKVEELGFGFHTTETTYWDESVCYEFSMKEVDRMEAATATLWECCLEAVQHVMDEKMYDQFCIPKWFVPHIEQSWEEDAPAIYGRFDFSMRDGIPKLLEFNADTPTSLFESSVVQWFWLQDRFPEKDQFNSIHEKLIAYWQYLKEYLKPGALHFSCIRENSEDFTTTEYLRDCAIQGGLETRFLYIDEIGWDSRNSRFADQENLTITNLFKLYPYEWLIHEEFGRNLMQDSMKAFWIEPSWKMILSNKAILPVLWELFPGHENLLESYFERDNFKMGINYAKKPLLSREGSNISLTRYGSLLAETGGEYGEEGYIYQELALLPDFDGHYPLIGSWVIGQEPAGIGIRESDTLITDNLSRFVPHFIG